MMRRGMRGMGGFGGGGMPGMGGAMGGAMGGKKTSPIIFAAFLVIGLCLGCSSMSAVCKMGFLNKAPASKKRR
jgi:preprotein translocase subunit SecG